MTRVSIREERMHELAAGRALGDLSPEERGELAELTNEFGLSEIHAYELAAASVLIAHYGLGGEALPAHLAASIEDEAVFAAPTTMLARDVATESVPLPLARPRGPAPKTMPSARSPLAAPEAAQERTPQGQAQQPQVQAQRPQMQAQQPQMQAQQPQMQAQQPQMQAQQPQMQAQQPQMPMPQPPVQQQPQVQQPLMPQQPQMPISQPQMHMPQPGVVVPLAPKKSRITPVLIASGWLAAAACLLLAYGAWRMKKPVEVVTLPPPSSTPTLTAPPPVPQAPTTGKEREGLLARGASKLEWATTKDRAAAEATGDVVWSPSEQKGYMRFRGLAKNDPGVSQYQLWIFDKNRDQKFPVDGGVFDVTADGDVVVPIKARLPVGEAVLFAVTVEKPGGVVVSKRERIVLTAKPAA